MPYSAQLALHSSLVQDTMTTRSIAQVSIGVVGPDALGQSVQNGFHEIIGDTPNRGWRYQLHNEPTLDFMGSRIWRENLGTFADGALNAQVLPQVTAQAGNTESYVQAGAILRVGQGLEWDFGPSLIQPGISGSDAYAPTRPVVWYVFAGAVGRLVANDIFIQGNNFQSSRGVALTPMQADFEIGGAIIVHGLRVTATEVLETPQFHGSGPAFRYEFVSISGRFSKKLIVRGSAPHTHTVRRPSTCCSAVPRRGRIGVMDRRAVLTGIPLSLALPRFARAGISIRSWQLCSGVPRRRGFPSRSSNRPPVISCPMRMC